MLATRDSHSSLSDEEDVVGVEERIVEVPGKRNKQLKQVLHKEVGQQKPLKEHSNTQHSSSTSTEKSSTTLVNNRDEKIQEYKHIKPLSVDDISRGGRISYPSLDDILNSSNDSSWMTMVMPSAPVMEDEQVAYPHLSDLSHQTLQYILPPIVKEKVDEKETPILPPLVVHKIQDGETLISISIKYGVTGEAIKMRNNMMDNDLTLYHKTELQIPEPTQLPTEDSFKKKELTEDEKRKLEERKKAWALTLFMRFCNVCEDEARYYLSIHDFDFKEAIQEHKSDLEWEKEHNEKLNKKKRKKQIDNFLDGNPKVLTLLKFLSFCIPNTTKKKEKDVELDLMDDEVISYDSDY